MTERIDHTMSRSFTRVDVFCDMSEGHITLTANAMNLLRFLSLRKAGGNTDDNDVMFHFHDFPVRDSMKPKSMPDMIWEMQNIMGMRQLVRSCFMYGVDKYLQKIGIQKLTEKIKETTGKSNEDAFNAAIEMMEFKHRPSTHVLWIADSKSPSFIQSYVRKANQHVQKTIDELQDKGGTPILCCLEECPENYEHDVWFGDTNADISRLDQKGNHRSI